MPESGYPPPNSGLACPCGLDPAVCTCQCDECVRLRLAADSEPRRNCSRCERELVVSAFGRRPNGLLQSWCRQCASAYARERRQAATTDSQPTRRRRSPTNPFDRPFGLEIEIIHGDMYVVRDALQSAGISCEVQAYNHDIIDAWKIVPDGSVARGFEVVSPILRGSEGRRQARAVFKTLRSVGATVDRSCGLHVHHDASDLSGADMERLVRTWRAEQGSIDGLVAPSRRTNGGMGNGWCYALDDDDMAAAALLARMMPERLRRSDTGRILGDPRSQRRYRSLNFRVFSLHGTVEIRQHQGTVNATKALSWVLFGQAYIARCKTETTAHNAIADVLAELESIGLEPATVSYLADRAEAFAGSQIAA